MVIDTSSIVVNRFKILLPKYLPAANYADPKLGGYLKIQYINAKKYVNIRLTFLDL
jgi:hypothetical protein